MHSSRIRTDHALTVFPCCLYSRGSGSLSRGGVVFCPGGVFLCSRGELWSSVQGCVVPKVSPKSHTPSHTPCHTLPLVTTLPPTPPGHTHSLVTHNPPPPCEQTDDGDNITFVGYATPSVNTD